MKKKSIVLLSAFILAALAWCVILVHRDSDGYIYNHSIRQNSIVNTIRLHKYGIIGSRIKIGIIDAGFFSSHPVFEKTRIISEYDFVRKDSSTYDPDHLKGVDHGTNVLSIIGGYKENELIGIAYGADFVLAKTDISSDRLFAEEYYAVAASEWLYNMGCKIITTSLSFNKFDDAEYYKPGQMNGKTALITQTADSLCKLGIIYCCSAGNNFENEWRIIEAPADGFHVLAAGSVDKNLNHSFFSSSGPTTDGRLKPDIVTPGEGVWTANHLPKNKPDYSWNHGTSLSAPIAAGLSALVLSCHPNLSAAQVIEAIKKSSSRSNNPDNLYGYGIPDAELAVSCYGPAFSNTPLISFTDKKLVFSTHIFSYFKIIPESVEIYLKYNGNPEGKTYKLKSVEEDFYSAEIEIPAGTAEVDFYFKATDKRYNSCKYPTGIIGEYFTMKIKDNKISPVAVW